MRVFKRRGLAAVACGVLAAAFSTTDAFAFQRDRKVDPPGMRADAFLADTTEATQTFWRYSKCVVITATERVENVLDKLPWRSDSDNDNQLRKSFIIPRCLGGLPGRYQITLSVNLGQMQSFSSGGFVESKI